jgi:hypothetical protein
MEKFIPAHYREEHFAEDLAKVVITNDSSVNVYIRHSINPPYLLPLKSLDYIDSKLIRSRGPACSNGNFTTCLKVGDSLVQFFPIDFYKKTEKISFTFCYFNDSSLLLKKEKKVTCLVKDRIIRVIEP